MDMKHLIVYLLAFASFRSYSLSMFQSGKLKRGMMVIPDIDVLTRTLPPAEWFLQKLDHFNPTSTVTWKQKYYTNATLYKEGGPVFLLIGPEGPASASWMAGGSWVEYAAEFNAMCFQLEHRYYGESRPTKDMSTENLVYLSSEQALGDLANFVQGMTREHKLPPNTKWVAFGGSYAGSLAAWLRLKYPHLVHAAVSISGPLLAIADFRDYFGVVQESLASVNENCIKVIQDATKEIDELLANMAGVEKLKTLFRLCDNIDPGSDNDVANLYNYFAGNFATIVQYNKINSRAGATKNITIEVACDAMTNDSFGSTLHRYAHVNNMLLDAYGLECLDFSYSKMVEALSRISWNNDGGRQWTYQKCTEFGFFQTSSQKSTAFGNKFPLSFCIQLCSDVFGKSFDAPLLNGGIKDTNLKYGALSAAVPNVVFVHGSNDPWYPIGITNSTSLAAPAIFIKGTSHCASMYPSSTADAPQLTAARKEIRKLIKLWTQGDRPEQLNTISSHVQTNDVFSLFRVDKYVCKCANEKQNRRR